MPSFISIECYDPETGHTPVSYFRGANVGVGGKHLFCAIAPGEPVRRATLNEIRRIDRMQIAKMLASHPGHKIRWRRCR